LRDGGMVKEEDGGFLLVGELPVKDAVKLLSRHNEERRTTDRRRLDGMVNYAQGAECHVMAIRRYFEDAEPTPCGACDICEPKLRRRRRRSKNRPSSRK